MRFVISAVLSTGLLALVPSAQAQPFNGSVGYGRNGPIADQALAVSSKRDSKGHTLTSVLVSRLTTSPDRFFAIYNLNLARDLDVFYSDQEGRPVLALQLSGCTAREYTAPTDRREQITFECTAVRTP
jgi:hypothetical protein